MVRSSSSLVSRLARFGGSVPTVNKAETDRANRLLKGYEELGCGWFWESDRDGRLLYCSAAALRQLDPQGRGLLGIPIADIFQMAGGSEAGERTIRFHMKTRTSFKEIEVRTALSNERTWSLSGRAVLDESGEFRGFVGSGSDLTDRRRVEAQVARLAHSDSLTGLPNRVRMQSALDISLTPRGNTIPALALFLLDLDRFKAVNDTLGHQAGDALLKLVAHRLELAFGEGALVGRLGGDEFQVIIPAKQQRDELSSIAQAAIGSLSRPYLINGNSITVGCSIGIAVAPFDGDDSDTLVRNADLALYAAKDDGRGIHKFFEPKLLSQAQLRKDLEDDLREALSGNQLSLVYQPQISTKTGLIVGYEALLRWTHPVRGAVSPVLFIPVAEECGLIDSIGEWVLRSAVDAAAQWPTAARIAVNVSPLQFSKPGFPAIVASALAHSGLVPDRLELEITENVFLGGADATDSTFRSLKTLGVRLALDDFGTGYSSLGYLKTAPFDKIKIDQSFVRGAMVDGSRNAAIIRAIVTLADALKMETTAEGVEAQDEIDWIKAIGCSNIQGYVYGRPLSQNDVVYQLEQIGCVAPSGVRISRSPRLRMLRSIIVESRGQRISARLRNISATGAMIDQCEDVGRSIGDEIMIELIEGELVPSIIRWIKADQIGIELLTSIDFRRIGGATLPRGSFGRADLA